MADEAAGELPRRVLLYTPSHIGGIAHHAHYQAEELARRGVEVHMLCRPDYPWAQREVGYRQIRTLPATVGKRLRDKLLRRLGEIASHYYLAWYILRLRPGLVLLEANTEYHALLWIWPHLLLRLCGVRYVANFHDPVRKGRYSFPLLHSLELKTFYATLRGGLIHGDPPREARIPSSVLMAVVPHGPFLHQALAAAEPLDVRQALGIAADRIVILSFGLITDYKNLDLLIAALPAIPGADLIVAGGVKSKAERPVAYYRDAAAMHGVADRVHFICEFIPEEQVGAYFRAADIVALTYRRDFVSQSGVLQLAVLFEKPVLASSGPGPLRQVVGEYGLGEVVEPDDVSAITAGLQRLMSDNQPRSQAFESYSAAASWAANIDGLEWLVRG